MIRDKIVSDSNTTLDELKDKVMELCVTKGWGDNGVQNPQHVAMAMTVEMSELLEHFQWLDDAGVKALIAGQDEKRVRLIGEEFADVMMYGLQIAKTLGIDITSEILRKIEIVKLRPNSREELIARNGGAR